MREAPLPRASGWSKPLYLVAMAIFVILLIGSLFFLLASSLPIRECSGPVVDGVALESCKTIYDWKDFAIGGSLAALAIAGLYLSNRALRSELNRWPARGEDDDTIDLPRNGYPSVLWTIFVGLLTLVFGCAILRILQALIGGSFGSPSGTQWIYAIGIPAFVLWGFTTGILELRFLFHRWLAA